MPFESHEWLLPQNLSSAIGRVVGVPIDVPVHIEHPLVIWPEWMRQADLRLERPSVRPEVEKPGRVIGSRRRGHREADTQGRARRVVLELCLAECRTSLQQHGYGVAGVAGAGDGAVDIRATDRTAKVGKWNGGLHPHQAMKPAKIACVADRALVKVEFCAGDNE